MPYSITISRTALRQLRRLDPQARSRVRARIAALADEPRPSGVVKLTGEQHTWRLRIGDYRVLYDVDDGAQAVDVVTLGHRREVYRRDRPPPDRR